MVLPDMAPGGIVGGERIPLALEPAHIILLQILLQGYVPSVTIFKAKSFPPHNIPREKERDQNMVLNLRYHYTVKTNNTCFS